MSNLQSITTLDTQALTKEQLKDEFACEDEDVKYLKEKEGIKLMKDLGEITDADWNNISSKASRAQKPIPERTLKRLKAASMAVDFYLECMYKITKENMKWECVAQIEASLRPMIDKSKLDQTKVITKCKNHAHFPMYVEHHVGKFDDLITPSGRPASYLMRAIEDPTHGGTVDPPGLLNGKPFSAENPSVISTLINCKSFKHPHIEEDKRFLHERLLDAFAGTDLINSAPSAERNKKDGRLTWKKAISRYANDENWAEIVRTSKSFLATQKYTGEGTDYTFAKHLQLFQKNVARLQCANNQPGTNVSIMSKQEQVTELLNSCEKVTDSSFTARMQIVKDDTGKGGKAHDIDLAGKFLNGVCLNIKRRKEDGITGRSKGKSKKNASISSLNLKKGNGPETGVPLRWMPPEEYGKISDAQRIERQKWMSTDLGGKAFCEQRKKAGVVPQKRGRGGGGGGKQYGKSSKKFKTAVSAVVQEELAKKEQNAGAQAKAVSALTEICKNAIASSTSSNKKSVNPDLESNIKQQVASLLTSKKDEV